MSVKTLKPCPFCGGNANPNYSYGKGRYGWCYWLWIECDICGCRTRAFASNDDDPFGPASFNAATKAKTLWENRQESSDSDG